MNVRLLVQSGTRRVERVVRVEGFETNDAVGWHLFGEDIEHKFTARIRLSDILAWGEAAIERLRLSDHAHAGTVYALQSEIRRAAGLELQLEAARAEVATLREQHASQRAVIGHLEAAAAEQDACLKRLGVIS